MATQQEVMKTFMQSLDETELSGRAAVDEAIQKSSSFTSYQEVIDKFIKDWEDAGNWHTFLVRYCGIILDNKDTGSILGKDAGGTTSKGSEDIIPSNGKAIYPNGTSFTVGGLTIYGVPPKNELSADEQYVIRGLRSWWLRDALNLIEESYGLTFTEENTTNARMKLNLVDGDSNGLLAAVFYDSEDGTSKKYESRELRIYMDKFQNMSTSNNHGETGTDSPLDRTLAHEIVHGVMASNINYFYDLPNVLAEGGTAEIIHGIDDLRYKDIISYARDISQVSKVLNMSYVAGNAPQETYAGGYIFMRYFLKQAATDTTFDYDTYRENVTVDDENFATNYWNEVLMTGSENSDTITNSGQNVTINDQAGDNLINNYSSSVKINSGSGSDVIYNEGESVIISTGAGADSIENYNSKVTIDSGAGVDLITNENSYVSIFDGNNSDVITNSGGNSTSTGGNGADFIKNSGENAIVLGEKGNDSIIGTGANNSLDAGAGNDSITNTGNFSVLWGGKNNDIIINGQLPDTQSAENSTDSNSEENSTAQASTSSIGANSTIFGGAGKDLINNYADELYIYGDVGNDTILSAGAYASIYGNAGNDYLENAGMSSKAFGDAGNDKIINQGTDIFIYGGAGKDSIQNNGDSVTAYGDAGNDVIQNFGFNVLISGGAGKDDFKNYGDSARILGDSGNDSIYNSGKYTSLEGGAGNDYFKNEGASIIISSGAGNDKIYNFGEHVTISGDAGNDSIYNYGKHVTYNFGKSSGKDIVVGIADNDTIKITSGKYSTKQKGKDVIVSVGNSSMTLKDATGIEINFISASGKTSTKTFASTSAKARGCW